MSYKAVLFDMDGTLLDTLEDLRDSTNHVLRQMGYPERSLEEMRRFVGNGAEKQIRRAVPEGTSEEKIMETLAAYRAYYQDHCQIKTRVYDGLLDMLSELKAKGIKLAVVSNKPDSAVQKLSREYFGDRMDFAVGPSDGVRCKPYPDMAETALKALGIAKKDAVFVGDSEVDVQTRFQNQTEACPIRRRCLPDTGRQRRLFFYSSCGARSVSASRYGDNRSGCSGTAAQHSETAGSPGLRCRACGDRRRPCGHPHCGAAGKAPASG